VAHRGGPHDSPEKRSLSTVNTEKRGGGSTRQSNRRYYAVTPSQEKGWKFLNCRSGKGLLTLAWKTIIRGNWEEYRPWYKKGKSDLESHGWKQAIKRMKGNQAEGKEESF